MQQTPKQNAEIEKEKKETDEKASWAEDQRERGYYYDDAHGYEVFDPEKEPEDEEEVEP